MKNKLPPVKLDNLPDGVRAVHWIENWQATDRQGQEHRRDILHLHYLKTTPQAAAALARKSVDNGLEGENLLNALRAAGMKGVNINDDRGMLIPSSQQIDLNDGSQLYRAYRDEDGLNDPAPGAPAIRGLSRKNPAIETLAVHWIDHVLQDPPGGYAHIARDDETGKDTLRAHFNKGKPGTGSNGAMGMEKFDGVTGNKIYEDFRDSSGFLHSFGENFPAVRRLSATEPGKYTGLSWYDIGYLYSEATDEDIAQTNASDRFPEKSYYEARGLKPPAVK